MVRYKIYICHNDLTINNNTNAYNNYFTIPTIRPVLWSIRRIDSTINDFMVIFNYLSTQIHKNHNYFIAPITMIKTMFIVIITTIDNNNISVVTYTNITININNSCLNKQCHNTTNDISTNYYKDFQFKNQI